VDSSASQSGNTTAVPDSTCSINTFSRNFDFPGNDGESNRSHVDSIDRVARHWDVYLFWIQSSSQQGSTRTRKCDAGYGIELMGEHFNYDQRKFRSVQNSRSGEVGSETIFTYHQQENVVWAEYSGGLVLRGTLLAIADENGGLDMRYQHINAAGELMTGNCRTLLEVLPDGRYRSHERWQWTCDDCSKGTSVIEEVH
jgi:hypothetical protein